MVASDLVPIQVCEQLVAIKAPTGRPWLARGASPGTGNEVKNKTKPGKGGLNSSSAKPPFQGLGVSDTNTRADAPG